MTEEDSIQLLKSEHLNLEKQLEEETSHSYSNSILISNIKRQKLRIKDKLANLKAG